MLKWCRIAKQSVYWMKVVSLGLILGIGIQFAQAWTSPLSAPPGGTISGPLTTGNDSQAKTGNLALNASNLYQHALIISGGDILASGSNGSAFGSVTLQGSKGDWSGINFKHASGADAGTLMMHPFYSGFYNSGGNDWRWYVDNNGNSYQKGVVRVGTTAASCTSTLAGGIRWTGTAFEGCDGSAWKPFGTGGGSTPPSPPPPPPPPPPSPAPCLIDYNGIPIGSSGNLLMGITAPRPPITATFPSGNISGTGTPDPCGGNSGQYLCSNGTWQTIVPYVPSNGC
ncbi:MAG: hypothetical protein WAU28_02925 [Candidatus Moraniibacteriota bacterium]